MDHYVTPEMVHSAAVAAEDRRTCRARLIFEVLVRRGVARVAAGLLARVYVILTPARQSSGFRTPRVLLFLYRSRQHAPHGGNTIVRVRRWDGWLNPRTHHTPTAVVVVACRVRTGTAR